MSQPASQRGGVNGGQEARSTALARGRQLTELRRRASGLVLAVTLRDGCGADELRGAPAVAAIACGAHHSLALTADGELYVWGKGQGGVLGLGGSPTYKAGTDVLIPTRVPNPSPSDKSDSDDTVNGIVPNGVAAGYYHSAVIMNELGDLFTWGRGTNGRLCNGETTAVSQPTSTSISGVLRVYLGGAHTIFKVGHRALMACGSNLRGQLGSGSSGGDASTPVAVRLGSSQEVAEASTLESDGGGDQISQSADGPRILSACAGRSHSAALTEEGELYTWGSNGDGELGQGDYTDRSSPTLVLYPYGTNPPSSSAASARYERIACGNRATIAVRRGRRVSFFAPA